MLKNTRYAQCLTLKSDDLGNQLINPNSVQITLDDAKLFYQEKLQAGYNIYNVTASGGFTALSAAAPGKWLCVFTAAPTATYSIPSACLSGAGSIAHTDIIITTIIVDSVSFLPDTISSMVVSGFTSASNYNNMSIQYNNIIFYELTSSVCYIQNIGIQNATFTTTGSNSIYLYYSVDKTISNVRFNTYTTFTVDTALSGHNLTMNNIYINSTTTSNGAIINNMPSGANTGYIYLSNMYISQANKTIPTYFQLRRLAGTRGFVVSNIYIDYPQFSLDLYVNNLGSSGNQVIYISIATTFVAGGGSAYSDVIIGYPSTVNQYISGAFASLDTTLCKSVTASTLYLNATISQVKRSIRGSFGTIRRQYYNLQFLDNQVLDDSLKNFDDQDRLLINRADILTATAAISADKIKGFNWTDSTGAVLKYPRIDESFLLLCEYGTYTHVLAWHKGRLNKTIYTDYWPTALYTPVLAFQIWEMPEEVEYRNVWNINDSPIAGAIQVQDITSKVVL